MHCVTLTYPCSDQHSRDISGSCGCFAVNFRGGFPCKIVPCPGAGHGRSRNISLGEWLLLCCQCIDLRGHYWTRNGHFPPCKHQSCRLPLPINRKRFYMSGVNGVCKLCMMGARRVHERCINCARTVHELCANGARTARERSANRCANELCANGARMAHERSTKVA